MAYPTEARAHLSEDKAEFVSITRVGIPRYRQLTRRWSRGIRDNLFQEMVRYLEQYTSADNSSASYSVTNPKAKATRQTETYSGTWRQFLVTCETEGKVHYIVQILREGYQAYSGTPADPLDQSEARIVNNTGDAVTGDLQCTQEWRYTDPSYHETILAALTAISSVTNPTIEGETVTGIFAVSEILSRPNEDGSVLFSRRLTQIHTVDEMADLSSLNPFITQNEDILNHFGFEEGLEQKIAYIYTGISAASRTYLMTTATGSDLLTQIAPGGSFEYHSRSFKVDPETGAAQFAVLFTYDSWSATYAADKLTIEGNVVSGWLRQLAIQATGESQAQAKADFSAAVLDISSPTTFSAGTNYNKGDAVTYSGTKYIFITAHSAGAWNAAHVIEANYILNNRSMREAGQGQFIVTGQMISQYEGTAAADAVLVYMGEPIQSDNFQRHYARRVWFRRSLAAKTTLTTITTGEARKSATIDGTTYLHMSFEVEDHQNGTYTVRQTLGELFDDSSTPYVSRIRPAITEYEQRMIARVWKHLTTAGKDALIAPAGDARSNYEFESVTYTHADCFIEDGEEDGWTVRQVLIEVHSGTANSDALIIRIPAAITQFQGIDLVRVWLHRSTTAKDALIEPVYDAGPPEEGNARTDYVFETITYTHVDVRIDDTDHGAYNVTQYLVKLNTTTTTAGAEIIRIRPLVAGTQTRLIQRVWRHCTLATKNTLATSGSAARSGDTIETVAYTHFDLEIIDRGSLGYDVIQTLADFTGDATVYFNNDFSVYKRMFRTKDDLSKLITYQQYIRMFSSESAAWSVIDDVADIVAGSASVVKVARFMYLGKWMTFTSAGNWA